MKTNLHTYWTTGTPLTPWRARHWPTLTKLLFRVRFLLFEHIQPITSRWSSRHRINKVDSLPVKNSWVHRTPQANCSASCCRSWTETTSCRMRNAINHKQLASYSGAIVRTVHYRTSLIFYLKPLVLSAVFYAPWFAHSREANWLPTLQVLGGSC